MPDNLPPPHIPAMWTDRVATHPESVAAAMTAVAGAGLILDSITHTHSLVVIPWKLGVPIGVILMIAGTLATLGVIAPRYRHLEQHGWHLYVTTMAILTVVLTFTHAYRLVWWLTLTLAAVAAVRSYALARKRAADRRITEATAGAVQ